MEAYCVKCKEKREVQNPRPKFTSRGQPGTSGSCGECGTKLFRMGRTEAHAGLAPPKLTPGGKRKRSFQKRRGKLVIVESPAKARTIGKFLGKGYTVKASIGHVRDLLRSQLSVDTDNGFRPKYRNIRERKEVIAELKKGVARAAEVYLATDLDREGEAIAWHLCEAAGVQPEQVRRVVFQEITRPAIEAAFAHPHEINMHLVNAQQARRILDRLVGYSLSPLLWAKVRGRLSAGRVQSVAVRLIVERERQIQNFIPEEYWSIKAELQNQAGSPNGKVFVARLHKVADKRVGLDKDFPLTSEAQVQQILRDLAQANWWVDKVKRGERRRNPAAPFTTSTLQQEASRKFYFTTRRTMAVAQQLYEGIELGTGGPSGLITYMRTDSVNVSQQAQQEVRDYIRQRYGEQSVSASPPKFKMHKGAQEAHEAIRPTSVLREPAAIKTYLSRDQYRLYKLIWKRFVASQMAAAIYDTVTVDIQASSSGTTYWFRGTSDLLRFIGFLALYEEALDEDTHEEAEPKYIPQLEPNDPLQLCRLLPEQHFTKPAPRYSEATLVKTLEKYGIGRPSTYAPTLTTIQNRGYVVREDKRLLPTEIGITVNDLLVEHFANVVDVKFTEKIEEDLDLIAMGKKDWVPILEDFYRPFAQQVARAEKQMPTIQQRPEYVERDCLQCGKPLVIRHGRYGKFIGCSGFPECRHLEPWLEKIGVVCPLDGGDVVERKTKKRRTFYGCSNYPGCEWTSWKRPLPKSCLACGDLLVVARRDTAVCTQCGNEVRLADLEELVG